jgi:drug/metabolite transporter (DMT)-like permease
MLYIGAALAVIPAAWRSGFSRIAARDAGRILLAAAAGGGVAPILLLLGLRTAPAASVALWLNLETVATAALAWMFFREHLDRGSRVGIVAVATAGVILAAPGRTGSTGAAALVALACLCWGLDITSLRQSAA